MNSPFRSLPSLRTALAIGAALAAYSCMDDDRVAGSSVTTGNPTEIQVGFTEGGAETAFSGTVALYGATQIPVPGFQPAPLDSWEVIDAKAFGLAAQQLERIPDSLWPKGSTVGDSLRLFNLVATSGSRGSITRNLAYRIKAKDFALAEGAWKAGRRDGQAVLAVGLTPRAKQEAFIDPSSLNKTKDNYLYLPGTGFASKANNGSFEFQPIPAGTHPLAFLAVESDPGSSNPEDSINVYSMDGVLNTGKVDSLSIQDLQFRVPSPAF